MDLISPSVYIAIVFELGRLNSNHQKYQTNGSDDALFSCGRCPNHREPVVPTAMAGVCDVDLPYIALLSLFVQV